MNHPNPKRSLHLGMRDGELTDKPYREFFAPRMAPLPEHAKDALLHGPVAAPLLPPLSDAPLLLRDGYSELEDGYGLAADGSFHVAIRTEMPDVTPAMIDWWFAWHSAEPQRYKLWHPRAHVHAQWNRPDTPELLAKPHRQRYIGRTSFVDEYIGSELKQLAISFISPSELGFYDLALSDAQQVTVICARAGLTDQPVDGGYLVHHVRRVAGGSEMRSRFYVGGPHASVHAGPLSDLASRLGRAVMAPKIEEARELLVHCSQEMSHLATFLPRIYAACKDLP